MARQPALIAVDFGAESARVMAVTRRHDALTLEELHRFPTKSTIRADGVACWDLAYLVEQTEQGLGALATRSDLDPISLGVDTWGVDFALCPKDGLPAPDAWPACYRNARNEQAMHAVLKTNPKRFIYQRTGVQFLPFNSLYQLHAALHAGERTKLDQSARLRFMPDLLHHHLCQAEVSEYSMATTSQLFDPRTRTWDADLLRLAGADPSLMQPVVLPGTTLGTLTPTLQTRLGLGPVSVVAVATHDTGSAFAAAPVRQPHAAILSSGTWSLLGVERARPLITDAGFALNLTNEGAADGGVRVLKNVMGLWLVQQCRKAFWPVNPPDYETVVALVDQAEPFRTLFPPDDPTLLNPPDMPEAIAALARRVGQPVPTTRAQTFRAVLESLALAYREVIEQLETATQEPITHVHILGGGCRNEHLNRWTANATGRPVFAGPVEATALGNALVQAMSAGWVRDLAEARAMLAENVSVREYEPVDRSAWDDAYSRYRNLPRHP